MKFAADNDYIFSFSVLSETTSLPLELPSYNLLIEMLNQTRNKTKPNLTFLGKSGKLSMHSSATLFQTQKILNYMLVGPAGDLRYFIVA